MGDDTVPSVDASAFGAVLGPTVETIRRLTIAVDAVEPRHGHQPKVPSVAVSEIAAEAGGYATRTAWDGPIRDTHSFGRSTLFAASDYARGFADLFRSDRNPVFAHLILARSVLEASVVAAWLNDPGVDPAERIKRGLCEQLYSAMELVRLKLEPHAKDRVKHWKAAAAGFNWEVTIDRDKPVVDGAKRPSIPKGIDELLLGEGEWKLGRVQWSYLSAVSHVTWYGLAQSFVEPPQAKGLSQSLAGVGTTSTGVRSQAVCVLRALRKAATARFTLMGWLDEEWNAASRRSEDHENELIRSSHVS